jgi:dipeptidyl aminopeptidase/acylaminoacyl peptidase
MLFEMVLGKHPLAPLTFMRMLSVALPDEPKLSPPLVLRGHEGVVRLGERPFSPDGKRIVSASEDATARIWNADGSGEPIVLQGSSSRMKTASWSPDGRRIVGALEDGSILVWNDLEPLQREDRRPWTATAYCMPLAERRRLLDFPEAQARNDLERCERQVAGVSVALSAVGQ